MHSKFKSERLRRGWSVGYIAERCDITDEKTIRLWENGTSRPRPAHLNKLCDLFGMTPEELGLDKREK